MCDVLIIVCAKAERDAWIRAELGRVGGDIEQQAKEVQAAQKALQVSEQKLQREAKALDQLNDELQQRKRLLSDTTTEHAAIAASLETALDNRKCVALCAVCAFVCD